MIENKVEAAAQCLLGKEETEGERNGDEEIWMSRPPPSPLFLSRAHIKIRTPEWPWGI